MHTLTTAYLSCEFAFRAHFQCVVRTYDLKCVENANQLVSAQGKIHEYSYVLGSVSAFTNRNRPLSHYRILPVSRDID